MYHPSFSDMFELESQPLFPNARRREKVILNRVMTGKAYTCDRKCRYGYIQSDLCDCQEASQTLEHLINECETYKYHGNLRDDIRLRLPSVVEWLEWLPDI